jgi:hypothetical protein
VGSCLDICFGIGCGYCRLRGGRSDLADLFWALATAPVVAGLAIDRTGLAGRFGVDAIAVVSMSAVSALGGASRRGKIIPTHLRTGWHPLTVRSEMLSRPRGPPQIVIAAARSILIEINNATARILYSEINSDHWEV